MNKLKQEIKLPKYIDFKLSNYIEGELLGQGSFGKVFQCFDKKDKNKKLFAIKKLIWDPNNSDQISEIIIHKSLKHVYIVPIKEIFSTPSMVLHIGI
jgi:serine/threonine protein kinase